MELHVQPKTVGLMFLLFYVVFFFRSLVLLLVVGFDVGTPGGGPDHWVIFLIAARTFLPHRRRRAHMKLKKKATPHT